MIFNYIIYFLFLLVAFSVILALLAHFDIRAHIYITYILWFIALLVFYFFLPRSTYFTLNI